MWALYDTQSDAVQVFIPEQWANAGGHAEQLPDGVLVDIDRDGRPMGVALFDPRPADLARVIPAATRRFDLDPEPILAAMQAALAVPGRAITIDVQELPA